MRRRQRRNVNVPNRRGGSRIIEAARSRRKYHGRGAGGTCALLAARNARETNARPADGKPLAVNENVT